MSLEIENITGSLTEQLKLEEDNFNKALQRDEEFDTLKSIWRTIKILKAEIEEEKLKSSEK